MTQRNQPSVRDQILDTALALAHERGWEPLRLHEVGHAAGLGLEDIRQHFREKDEIIDAWFDRADSAMLRLVDRGAVAGLSPDRQIRALLIVWLEALTPYHRVTREMVGHKLEFGHVHVQFPAVLRISRTVQWLREGTDLDAPLPWRAIEETALTAFFVAIFASWLRDESTAFRDTRDRMDRGLRLLSWGAERVLPRH